MAACVRSARVAVRATAGVAARSMATAAASPAISVDWASIRSKQLTDVGRAEIDKARDAFNRRLAAANAASDPAEIDWAAYKAKLGADVDIDAIKRDFEAVQAATPAITYDAEADKATHAAAEDAWTAFASFCKSKIGDLHALQAEQADHKLHRWYHMNRLWNRFPGLYEQIHHKARGEWDDELWSEFLRYKGRLTPMMSVVDKSKAVSPEKRREIVEEFGSKAGFSKEVVDATVAAVEKRVSA